MLCSKCGTMNNDGSKFCISCGNTLQNLENQQFQSSEVSNNIIQNNQGFVSNDVYNQPVVNNVQTPFDQNVSMNDQLTVNNMQGSNNQSININNQPIINDVSTKNNKEKKPSKLNKKVLFIIIGIVLLVAVIVLVCVLVFKDKPKQTKSLVSIVDLNQPILVQKDSDYVYIDTSGKLLKDIRYNDATEFIGDYASVELEDGTAAIIDKNQNVKVTATSYYAIRHIYEYDLWLIDGILYNNNFKPLTDNTTYVEYEEYGYFTYNTLDNKEYGIINEKGKKVYTDKCEIDSFYINEYTLEESHYAIVGTTCYVGDSAEKNEYIVALETGKILYTNEYKKQYPNEYEYELNTNYYGIYFIYDNNYNKINHMYIKDNEIVYSVKEELNDLMLYGDYLILDYGYSYDELGKEQRYYYYDIKTKKLSKTEPDIDIEEENKKLVDIKQRQIVKGEYGYGLIDNKNVIIPCMYDRIQQLPSVIHEYLKIKEHKDLVYVEDGNKTFVYDANAKKEFFSFEKANSYEIVDDKISVFIIQEIFTDYTTSKTIVYNLITGKSMEFNSKSSISVGMNYFKEERNGKTIYYNTNFEKIYTEN